MKHQIEAFPVAKHDAQLENLTFSNIDLSDLILERVGQVKNLFWFKFLFCPLLFSNTNNKVRKFEDEVQLVSRDVYNSDDPVFAIITRIPLQW